jgi:methyl-accepting chemotaxis protein
MESSQEQGKEIVEIKKRIENMNNVIQSNAVSAEKTVTVEELYSMSRNIETFVQKLYRLVTE